VEKLMLFPIQFNSDVLMIPLFNWTSNQSETPSRATVIYGLSNIGEADSNAIFCCIVEFYWLLFYVQFSI